MDKEQIESIKKRILEIDEKLKSNLSEEEINSLTAEKEKCLDLIIGLEDKHKKIYKDICAKVEEVKKRKENVEKNIAKEVQNVNEIILKDEENISNEKSINEQKEIQESMFGSNEAEDAEVEENLPEEPQKIEREESVDAEINFEKKEINKNKKQLLLVIIITAILLGGVMVYKNLPNHKKETKEEIVLADPDDFRIQDIHEDSDDEDKKRVVIKNDKVEEAPKAEAKKEVKQTTNVSDREYDERIKKDSAEIDQAINELENHKQNDNLDEKELRESRRSEIGFYKKPKDLRNKQSQGNNGSLNTNFYPAVPNANKMMAGNEGSNEKTDKEKKEDFIKSQKDINFLNRYTLTPKITKTELKVGSVIPAVLLTEINTEMPGNILAQTREDIYDTVTGKYLLIPKGSKLYGKYDAQITRNQTRILIVFTRLMLPNGDSITLENMQGLDQIGNSGLKDRVDKHTWELIGNAILGSVLNFGNNISKSVTFDVGGAKLGLGGNPVDSKGNQSTPFEAATGKLLQNSIDREPTLSIRRGYKFNILVSKDMLLKEYKE